MLVYVMDVREYTTTNTTVSSNETVLTPVLHHPLAFSNLSTASEFAQKMLVAPPAGFMAAPKQYGFSLLPLFVDDNACAPPLQALHWFGHVGDPWGRLYRTLPHTQTIAIYKQYSQPVKLQFSEHELHIMKLASGALVQSIEEYNLYDALTAARLLEIARYAEQEVAAVNMIQQ